MVPAGGAGVVAWRRAGASVLGWGFLFVPLGGAGADDGVSHFVPVRPGIGWTGFCQALGVCELAREDGPSWVDARAVGVGDGFACRTPSLMLFYCNSKENLRMDVSYPTRVSPPVWETLGHFPGGEIPDRRNSLTMRAVGSFSVGGAGLPAGRPGWHGLERPADPPLSLDGHVIGGLTAGP